MSDCTCFRCQGACQRRPGWFLPGEAEKAAESLNMPLRKFFRKYLAVDWGKEPDEPGNTFVLAPAIVSGKPGVEYPLDPIGRCVFYTKEGRCTIHEAAPFECQEYMHTDTHEEVIARHKRVKDAWMDHQEQVLELLGRQYPRTGNRFDDLGEWIP